MSINTQAADAIEAGAKLIRAGKWCQGYTGRADDGRYVLYNDAEATSFCGLGALFRQQANHAAEMLAKNELHDWARRQCGNNFATWQDAPGRTAEEVADAMEAAAAALRGRE